jgi:hypothetical protein
MIIRVSLILIFLFQFSFCLSIDLSIILRIMAIRKQFHKAIKYKIIYKPIEPLYIIVYHSDCMTNEQCSRAVSGLSCQNKPPQSGGATSKWCECIYKDLQHFEDGKCYDNKGTRVQWADLYKPLDEAKYRNFY